MRVPNSNTLGLNPNCSTFGGSMSTSFKDTCNHLEECIQESYTGSITLPEAESLAAKFLHALLQVSEELKKSDLDSRMRKSGLKAIRAAIYMETVTKSDKKPSDVLLEQMVNMNELVNREQNDFDKAETERDDLERYYNIFKEAHIYYRGLAKGRFE